MRYKPSEWGAVALLMRDSTYKVLEAISSGPKSWSELVRATGLTEPGLLKVLKERPRTFNPYLLKGMTVYKEPKALDRKTAELVAVSAAAALHCEHCLEAHMGRAVAEGATLDEIMDTILVAGSISESSMLSVAFRKYKQLEGKMKKGKAKDE